MKTNSSEFYTIERKLLGGIELRLDTEYNNDWMPVFVNKDGYTISQFNEEYDLTDSRDIRITADFALKIWEMVELKNVMDVKRAEVKAELEFEREYNQ